MMLAAFASAQEAQSHMCQCADQGSRDCLFGNRASNIARARELLAVPAPSKQPETTEAVLDEPRMLPRHG
jgi:hypothetical protein